MSKERNVEMRGYFFRVAPERSQEIKQVIGDMSAPGKVQLCGMVKRPEHTDIFFDASSGGVDKVEKKTGLPASPDPSAHAYSVTLG